MGGRLTVAPVLSWRLSIYCALLGLEPVSQSVPGVLDRQSAQKQGPRQLSLVMELRGGVLAFSCPQPTLGSARP